MNSDKIIWYMTFLLFWGGDFKTYMSYSKCLGESRTWCQTLWFGYVCIYIYIYLFIFIYVLVFGFIFFTHARISERMIRFSHQLYIWATSWIWGPVHLAVPLVSCQCHGMAIGQWKMFPGFKSLNLGGFSFRLFSIYDDHKLNPHRACWLNHQDWSHPCDEVLPLGYLKHYHQLSVECDHRFP